MVIDDLDLRWPVGRPDETQALSIIDDEADYSKMPSSCRFTRRNEPFASRLASFRMASFRMASQRTLNPMK
jgi:hypothetical protein